MVILVWTEAQVAPARLYAAARDPGAEIRISASAADERDRIIAGGGEAVVYHFESFVVPGGDQMCWARR